MSSRSTVRKSLLKPNLQLKSKSTVQVREEKQDLLEVYEFPRGFNNPLGTGSFGVVHEVRRRDLSGQRFPLRALKLIQAGTGPGQSALKYIEDEILSIQQLQCADYLKKNRQRATFNSCAMVKLYDVFTIENRTVYCLEMEYIIGGDGETYQREMQNLIKQDKIYDALQRLARNFGDMVATLLRIHQACTLHRDIKPANILYDKQNDQLVLSDFGLACFLPYCGGLGGTKQFLDPYSLYNDPNVVDERSDIYALGITFYEMVTAQEIYFKFPIQSEFTPRYLEMLANLDNVETRYRRIVQGVARNFPYVTKNVEQAPLVMIEAIKHMINPFRPDLRPLLSSVLDALAEGNAYLIQNFNLAYSCSKSKEQHRLASEKRSRKTKAPLAPAECKDIPERDLEIRARKFIDGLIEEEEWIDGESDLKFWFDAEYKKKEPCLYHYGLANMPDLLEYYNANKPPSRESTSSDEEEEKTVAVDYDNNKRTHRATARVYSRKMTDE